MHTSEPVHRQRRSVFNRVVRVTLKIVFTVFALVIVLVLLVQVPYVQDIIRGRAEKYLSRKLKTRVRIGHLDISFFRSITLKDVYVEDLRHDTLLSAGLIDVRLSDGRYSGLSSGLERRIARGSELRYGIRVKRQCSARRSNRSYS